MGNKRKQVPSIFDSASIKIKVETRSYRFQIAVYEKTWGESLRH